LRHIDFDLLEPPISNAWIKQAQDAYEEVKKATAGKARSEKINEFAHLWRELKGSLKKLSHEKCWYCESAGHRIIGDVDHYRPKNKIKHEKDNAYPVHIGYWWLAFDWRNYRYACELCNRLNRDPVTNEVGGKGSYFPLLDENKRVYDECKRYELLQETPLLLDPIVETDAFLLTIDSEGKVQSSSEDEHDIRRVKTSITHYNLDHYDLKERRRVNIYRVVENIVEEAEMFFWQREEDKNNIAAREGYLKAVGRLKKMINERAEYSSAARAALKAMRTPANKIWIENLLMAS